MSDFLGEILSLGEPPPPKKSITTHSKDLSAKNAMQKVARFGGFVFPEITTTQSQKIENLTF
jgi:hypothetical protein